MKYEIDFVDSKEEGKEADSICFRYWNEELKKYTIGIYDGGIKKRGEALVEHIMKYYQTDEIDFVICSHPDQDHASGLSLILENFKVKKLYMNRPWNHLDELYERVKDGRITIDSLEDRLKKKYNYIYDLEKIAIDKNIKIYDSFEGVRIENTLKILSPTKEFYLDLLAESDKTPEMKESIQTKIFNIANDVKNFILEAWDKETLSEDVSTSPENETSVIVYCDFEEAKALLCGDAGVRALKNALDYCDTEKIDIKEIKFQQMPHHGSKHNVSPSILDRLVGPKINESLDNKLIVFSSTSSNSKYPRQVVINAYKRRGVKVYSTFGSTKHHKKGDMPDRTGWTTAIQEEFKFQFEDSD